MATIETRTAGTGTHYRVKVRLKGYPTQSATFERKTDAKKWAQQVETAIREGRHFKTAEAKRHTLAELLARYLREVLPAKKSAKDRKRHLLWWQSQLGEYRLADITPALIVECRDKLTRGITRQGTQRSGGTANRYLAALSHVFTVATREWHWTTDNPVSQVRKFPESRGRVRFLSDDERCRLLAACKAHGEPLYTLVVLAISTGARQGEMLSLRWPDVDLQRGLIVLHETKNGERRALPLHGYALACVQQLSQVRRLDTELLFPSRRNPQRPLSIHNIFVAAVKSAELDNFRFHDLRHCAASYLAMNGASLAEIAEVLGHKTLSMVKRYAHLSEAHTARVVAAMNNKIFR